MTLSPLTRDYPEPQLEDKTREESEARGLTGHPTRIEHTTISSTAFSSYVLLVSRLTGDEAMAMRTNSEVDGRPFVLRLPITPEELFSELTSKLQPVSVP